MQIPKRYLPERLPGDAKFLALIPDADFEAIPGSITEGGKFREEGQNRTFVLPSSIIPVGATGLSNGLAIYRVIASITDFLYVLKFVGDDGRWYDRWETEAMAENDAPVASIMPGFAQFIELDEEATAEFLAPLKGTGFAYVPQEIGMVMPR